MSQKIEVTEVTGAVDRALAAIYNTDTASAKAVRAKIIEELKASMEAEAESADEDEDDAKEPRQKNQFVIVVSDPNGKITEDLTGWVIQMPENESVSTTMEKLHRAMYEFNTTKKGRMMPVKTIADGLENVSRKHFKEQGNVSIKTKTPVFVVRTDNVLPTENNTNQKGVI